VRLSELKSISFPSPLRICFLATGERIKIIKFEEIVPLESPSEFKKSEVLR